jgi:septum formation protein
LCTESGILKEYLSLLGCSQAVRHLVLVQAFRRFESFHPSQLVTMYITAPLYLASQSQMRKQLLLQSHIPFTVLEQTADETACDWNQPCTDVVLSIARSKMDHVSLPLGTHCYVLTADTLCMDVQGHLQGKPENEEAARAMLTLWQAGCLVVTGFCLDKKEFKQGTWQTERRIEQAVVSKIDFSVPARWVDEYLRETPTLSVAGGMKIEDFGFQFVRTIEGSYSNILGLPLFEVREALTELGFFA